MVQVLVVVGGWVVANIEFNVRFSGCSVFARGLKILRICFCEWTQAEREGASEWLENGFEDVFVVRHAAFSDFSEAECVSLLEANY